MTWVDLAEQAARLLLRAEAAERERDRLIEYGDALAREVLVRPGEGHLADALEAWRSVLREVTK